jgi:hypothetical protein
MKSIFALTFAAALLVPYTAFAARPANIARTTWTLQVNNDVAQLFIDTQGGAGAPGASICRHIRGSLNGIAGIRGWYCPSTGRIHFVHTNADNVDFVVRVFTGSVSDTVNGGPLHMAGTATVLISAFGDLGEYNFSATTQ